MSGYVSRASSSFIESPLVDESTLAPPLRLTRRLLTSRQVDQCQATHPYRSVGTWREARTVRCLRS